MPPKSSTAGPHAINFSWLIRLRWGAIVFQLLLIAGVRLILGIELPLTALFLLIGVEALSNAGLTLWLRRAREIEAWMIGLVMGLDVALLTAMLRLTGGPFNPFTTLYLVNIALAAVVLPAVWTWFLTALSLFCFGLLFLDRSVLDEGAHMMHGPDQMLLHLEGMWVAFGLAAAFIVYFVQRVTRALAERDTELAAARSLTARNEKLASLATLAAGAAHQLSTPLSTIAVVAKELERQLERGTPAAESVGDARLIREQVERCRDILLQLAADAGESTGEAARPTPVGDLLRAAMRGLPETASIEIVVAPAAGDQPLEAPPRALAQAIRGLLKNACEASGPGDAVRVHVDRHSLEWAIEIEDRGPGMTEDILARAGEPFFTTKGPDRGMGLGVFLARTVVERLGGTFVLDSAPGRGTRARLTLPAPAPPPAPNRGAPARHAA